MPMDTYDHLPDPNEYQPVFGECLADGWTVALLGNAILLTAPDEDMETADAFLEAHCSILRSIATRLQIVIRVGWIGCRRPFQVYPRPLTSL
jgi:hypothetical protein